MAQVIHPAQIVFLVDSTGSMAPCIQRLKDNIHAFMESLSSGNEQIDWSARIVGFRDTETDREKHWFVGLDDHLFVKTSAELQTQLSSLEAKYGGVGEKEIPETGLDAVWAVSHASDWAPVGSMHRVIVLLSDAPTKSIVTDNVANPPLDHTDDVQELGSFLASEHFKVQIYAYACPEYERLGNLPNSDFFDVSQGGAADSYLGLENLDFDKVADYLSASITGAALPGPVAGAAPPAQPTAPPGGTVAVPTATTSPVPPPSPTGQTAAEEEESPQTPPPAGGPGPSLPPGGTQEA
jgi:hypothetical protein